MCNCVVHVGRSLSAMATSQIIHNPDLREGHMLKGWFEHDGHNMDFQGYRNDGPGGGGGGWYSSDGDVKLLSYIFLYNLILG